MVKIDKQHENSVNTSQWLVAIEDLQSVETQITGWSTVTLCLGNLKLFVIEMVESIKGANPDYCLHAVEDLM